MVVNRPPIFLYTTMIRIDYAKINSDGSVSIKATYNNTTQPQESSYGIYKYFITKTPISKNPDDIERTDVSLVAYYKQLNDAVDNIEVTINESEIVSDTLNEVLYVYVVTNEDELMLCSCKDKYAMAAMIPLCKIYNIFMGFINSLNHDECNIPMNFIDQIMRYIYLISAQSSGNLYRVKQIWDQYFRDTNISNGLNSNCWCNG